MYKQLDFVKTAESPLPYPHVNNNMELVLNTLCPSHVDFKEYTKTPIPLDVMKQLSFSIKEKHFKRIEVWYDDKAPDPIAVGITEQYFVYNDKYNRMEDSDRKVMLFDSTEAAKEYADLIGFNFKCTGTEKVEKYLIARWADELRPVEELKTMAKARLLEKYGAELKIEIENATQALKKLQDNIVRYLTGEINENELKGKSRW
jgi:hypothetical protein